MRFFLISQSGDGAGMAWQLLQEGHEVICYVQNINARWGLKGLVKHVVNIREGLNLAPDVVVFDMVGMGKKADELRQAGWNVVGASEWCDKLEFDRKFAMVAMDSFGIKSPRSYAFKNLADAYQFVTEHRKLLVLKPFDNKNTAYTYVPKNQDDLLTFIRHIKSKGVDGKVLLQEYVDGTEVSTEVWYSLGRPIAYPNSTFETKKLMSGDVGPATGCQTSVVFGYPKREPRIIQQSLKKIGLFLERIKYTGPLDINGIIRKGKFYGLEWTPRFGYSALYALMRLLKEPFGEFLYRISQGDDSPMNLKEGFGYSLRVSIPPYPYAPEDTKLKAKIYSDTKDMVVKGLSKKDWMNVYPLDLYRKGGEWLTAGFDGVVCECTGFGQDMYEAEREAVGYFKKLQLPQKQARLGDGARVASRRMEDLRREGYEVPPFIKPEPLVTMSEVKTIIKKERSNVQSETQNLARKLGVRPAAFADPRVKSGH